MMPPQTADLGLLRENIPFPPTMSFAEKPKTVPWTQEKSPILGTNSSSNTNEDEEEDDEGTVFNIYFNPFNTN